MSLKEKAMLVELNVSQCTFRKLDKSATKEVNAMHNAKGSAGNYNKACIAKEDLLRIVQAVGNARTTHYKMTMPWADSGPRLLPAALYWEYTTAMRDCKAVFDGAVYDFFQNYDQYKSQAKQQLGTLFNEQDYPSLERAKAKFAFKTVVTPMPDAADFRVNIQADELDKIRQEITTSSVSMMATAHKDLWQRLYAGISRMSERLSEDGKVFRDSLVNNLCELTSILPKLNITGDPELERLRQEVEQKLCSTEPGILRTDAIIRKTVAADAQAILDVMAGYCGPTNA